MFLSISILCRFLCPYSLLPIFALIYLVMNDSHSLKRELYRDHFVLLLRQPYAYDIVATRLQVAMAMKSTFRDCMNSTR